MIKKILLTIFLISILAVPQATLALTATTEAPVSGGSGFNFEPPLGNLSVQDVIGRIIYAILGIVGSVALLMFIIGGFMWMTAAGDTERITKAKNILIWSILGLIVIFAAFGITRFVLTAILE